MSSGSKRGSPLAADFQVGGDADRSGISQPITQDDIDAIAMSSMPIAERRAELMALRQRIISREAGDFGEDMDELLSSVQRAISGLDRPIDTETSRSSLGADPDERIDALSPDELSDRLRDKT